MDSHFQVIVLGTGLSESIAAAALARAGLKVAHIDVNPYYGADEASLSPKELQEFITNASSKGSSFSGFHSASLRGDLPSTSRDYSLSLFPSILPSRGPLITSLIGSGVARYGGFKLLESVSVFSADGLKSVPGSKEEIFKSKDLSLIDKRRLMRFLMFAAGEFESSPELQGKENTPFISFLVESFSLNTQLASVLVSALALCEDRSDTALPSLERIRRYLRSSGRYGPSPFLVGQYGGLGELAQGFSRICAVSGGIYILGRDLLAVQSKEQSCGDDEIKNFRLKLSDIPEDLTSDLIISSINYLPHLDINGEAQGAASTPKNHAHCIAFVDGAISRPALSESSEYGSEEEPRDSSQGETTSRPIDAALLVFPPRELSSGRAPGPVNVLINGEGTLSCPRGKSILYLSAALEDAPADEVVNAEHVLRPYLDATLSVFCTPDGGPLKETSSAFYIKARPVLLETRRVSLREKNILISPPLPGHFAEAGDLAATTGEALFRDALRQLGRPDAGDAEFWSPLLPGLDDEDEDTI